MNYIKRLEMELQEANQDKVEVLAGIDELFRYLSLPKFEEDTTVQVSDIFLRLQHLRNQLITN